MRKKIIGGAIEISGGQGLSLFLSFVRNLFIARMLGPEQFGIGMTFAVTISFLEMAADLSFEKFIVQDKQGDDPRLEATTHAFMLMRGILIVLVLLVLANTIARAFGVPDVAWGFQVLALAPLCRGLTHLSVIRVQRQLRYRPQVATQLAGDVCGLLVGVALAWWLGDYRAMLYAIIARHAVYAVSSHFLGEGRYRVGLEGEIARRAWRFGWPLMVTGLVVFVASQGDRVLVVRAFGLESLGIYGVATLATQLPGMFVLKVVGYIGLPLLSAKQDDRTAFYDQCKMIGAVVTLFTVSISILLFATLTPLIPVVFGSEFNVSRALVNWLIVGLALRIFRAWPTVVTLALADTKTSMFGNFLRTAGIAFALIAILLGGDIVSVVRALVVGELLATAFMFGRIRWKHDLRLRWALIPGGVGAMAIVASFCLDMYAMPNDLVISLLGHGLSLTSALLLLLVLSADIRQLLRATLGRKT